MGRSAVRVALVMCLRLIAAALWACDAGNGSPACSCPGESSGALIELLCAPTSTPSIQVTGPCAASSTGPQSIVVQFQGPFDADGGGTCEVGLTFAGGATAVASFTYSSQSDPCCGLHFSPAPSRVAIGSQCGDSGADGGLDSGVESGATDSGSSE
jgi:hypothetical protein